jgi:hypothetical protein
MKYPYLTDIRIWYLRIGFLIPKLISLSLSLYIYIYIYIHIYRLNIGLDDHRRRFQKLEPTLLFLQGDPIQCPWAQVRELTKVHQHAKTRDLRLSQITGKFVTAYNKTRSKTQSTSSVRRKPKSPANLPFFLLFLFFVGVFLSLPTHACKLRR